MWIYILSIFVCVIRAWRLEEILIHTYTLKGAMIVSDAGLEGRSAWRWLVWYSKYEVPLTVNRKLSIVTMYTVNALPWKSWPASFSATFPLCFIFWLSATITMQSITSCGDNNKWTYILAITIIINSIILELLYMHVNIPCVVDNVWTVTVFRDIEFRWNSS